MNYNSFSEVVVGLDIGSHYTKAVIIDLKGSILSHKIIKSGAVYAEAANNVINESLKSVSLDIGQVKKIILTGYGRQSVNFDKKDVHQITEITCHAKGATWVFPNARTIVDIGGQDSKVISVGEQGMVRNFAMNDICAAGTGRFLEVMAGALDININEMGELSFHSKENLHISSMCTVFAETEVISLITKGHAKADIINAVHQAIARRVTGLVAKIGVMEPVVMTGGVAKNAGVVYALKKQLGVEIKVPEEPQIIGALGAALVGRSQIYSECNIKVQGVKELR